MPVKGSTVLYRPIPADFAEMFIKLGWSSISAHYAAHGKTVRKWLDIVNARRSEAGLEPLQISRARYVARNGRTRGANRVAHLRRVGSYEPLADLTSAVTRSAPEGCC